MLVSLFFLKNNKIPVLLPCILYPCHSFLNTLAHVDFIFPPQVTFLNIYSNDKNTIYLTLHS